jgi:hypothetical protein
MIFRLKEHSGNKVASSGFLREENVFIREKYPQNRFLHLMVVDQIYPKVAYFRKSKPKVKSDNNRDFRRVISFPDWLLQP